MTQTIEQFIESRVSRSIKMQDRHITRIERRESDAENMIGTLIRDGKAINYVYPVGGKYREGNKHELISYLVRNNYA